MNEDAGTVILHLLAPEIADGGRARRIGRVPGRLHVIPLSAHVVDRLGI